MDVVVVASRLDCGFCSRISLCEVPEVRGLDLTFSTMNGEDSRLRLFRTDSIELRSGDSTGGISNLSRAHVIACVCAYARVMKSNTVTSANLLQQARCNRFRPEQIEQNHPCQASLIRFPCRLQRYSLLYKINDLLHKSDIGIL